MIHRLKTTASTMIDAAELALHGAPHGTAVVAEEQTAGIGRHGHNWHSAQTAGLYLSIVLRLPTAPPILTLALGLAVQQAVDDAAEVSTDIRWPNDVMLSEKKLCGIMIQAAERDALIAGIGLNVNQTAFPQELRAIATSLRIETGIEHSKEAILQRVLAEVNRHIHLAPADLIRRFEARSTWARGKGVEVEGRIRGITAGLDSDGFLLVRTDSGIQRILAGGVRAV